MVITAFVVIAATIVVVVATITASLIDIITYWIPFINQQTTIENLGPHPQQLAT